jgi:hypothetical protein
MFDKALGHRFLYNTEVTPSRSLIDGFKGLGEACQEERSVADGWLKLLHGHI